MKSIIFGFSLVSAAVAQISVIGMSMVPAETSAAASGSSGYGSQSPAVTATPTPSDSGYGGASPSVQTAAPVASTSDFYQVMPYSSYMAGGYKSLDCGYGYSKGSDGSCNKESWVSVIFQKKKIDV